jgi:hypothetical protein
MKQVKQIMSDLELKYQDIDYYHLLIDKIENNKHTHPDIAIESCKSLIEGMFKFMWRQLDEQYNEDIVDNLKFPKMLRKTLDVLIIHSPQIETDFCTRAASLIDRIGEIRNDRADIGHGRLAPKRFESPKEFSILVVEMVDALLFYILSCFYNIDLAAKEIPLKYEDNPDFNEYLNAENEFGYLNYSQALFDQDIIRYKEELENYKADMLGEDVE